MRHTLTIPAAGQKEVYPITGRSIIVEWMSIYSVVDQVPTMNLRQGVTGYPLYPRSSYPNDGVFNSVEIVGTAESAGDTITLLSSDECVELKLNINFDSTQELDYKNSFAVPMDDTPKGIPEASLIKDGRLPKSVILAAAGDGIRYMWNGGGGTNPTNGGNNYLIVEDAQPIEVKGIEVILGMVFINETNGQTPDLIVTPIY